MNYFLIDYENVKIDNIKDLPYLDEGAVLIIFYSDQHKNISLDVIDDINAFNIKLYCQRVRTGEKNALDFQLSSYLGYLIGRGSSDDKYHIVSNDKGYDCLYDYWKGQGKSVGRIACLENIQPSSDKTEKKKGKDKENQSSPEKKNRENAGSQEKKNRENTGSQEKKNRENTGSQEKKARESAGKTEKKNKESAGSPATLEEMRRYLSDDEEPEQVLAIFNQNKSRQKIYVGLAKRFRDSQKTGAVYKKLKPLFKEKRKL